MDFLNSPLSREEYIEYQYLQSKYIFDKNLDEKEQKRYDELQEKYIKYREYKYRLRLWQEEKEHQQNIIDQIKPYCKFKATFVKGGISNQTGEYDAFYDIEIESYPLMKILDSKTRNEIDKYNKLRGRSKNLSDYACYKQELAEYHYFIDFFEPALNQAYEDYLKENFYGKHGEHNYVPCKKYQIDWFDEVFITDKEKIPTTFQKWIKDIKEKEDKRWGDYRYKLPEPESWERAWIDSIEYGTKQEFYNFCCDLRKNPEDYPDISNYIEYLNEASKIIGKKFI